MSKIVDPDQLNQATEVVFDSAVKTIQLLVAGNLNDTSPGKTSGVTLQAVYSFAKEEWKTDAALNKFRFPIKMITEAKGELINGWSWEDQQTMDLIRDGGWYDSTNDNKWACIISLGAMVNTQSDQAYYQQVIGFDQATGEMDKTGEVNEAIEFYNSSGASFDYSTFLKLYLREWYTTYDSYNLIVAQGYSELDYTVYRLPLANAEDINISVPASVVDASTPYTNMTIDFFVGSAFDSWASSTFYPINHVVLAVSGASGGDGHWWRCNSGHDSNTAWWTHETSANWDPFPGEIEIGTDQFYAFNRIVDAGSAKDATTAQIYAFCQRALQASTDINSDVSGDSYGTVYGNIAIELCYFVGSQLTTQQGVFIANFNTNYTNSIDFYDITVDGGGLDSEDVPVTTTKRTFPFVAAGTLIFSSNLNDELDADTLYRMYFDDANGNLFDSANAIVVLDNGGSPIQGEISALQIGFDFDYDGNVQGGRSSGTDADVVVVAQGLSGAEWVETAGTLTRATGLEIRINASDERNYSNPA